MHRRRGRRRLRTRILAASAKCPASIPAPSDLLALAERLTACHSDASGDKVERHGRCVLCASYASAVAQLIKGVAAVMSCARSLVEPASAR